MIFEYLLPHILESYIKWSYLLFHLRSSITMSVLLLLLLLMMMMMMTEK